MKRKVAIVPTVSVGLLLAVAVGILMGPAEKSNSSLETYSANVTGTNETNVVASSLVETKANGGGAMLRTMRFLELLKDFFPADQQEGLKKTIAEGVEKQPDRFGKLAIQYMELYGHLKNAGKLGAYYDAQKKERLSLKAYSSARFCA